MRKYLVIPIIIFIIVLLSACMDKGGKEFLPDSCQSYNQFMYLASDDLHTIMVDNGYNIRNNGYIDMVPKVKKLVIEVNDPTQILNLNGIECFPYINDIELKGKSIKDISPLVNLDRVESLTIDNTRIFDLDSLTNMTKLKSLSITNNNILQSLSGIEKFKRLENVDLTNNGLVEVKQLGELINLEEINLNNNEITTVNDLGKLPKLTTLRIENNQVDFNDADELSGFTSLQHLYAKSNNICKTESLVSLQSLTFLDLSDNNLGNYKGDESCSLNEPDFTFIKDIASLDVMYASKNGIQSLNTLQEIDLSNLQELDFSNNLIPSIQPLIQNTTLYEGKLTKLNLSNNKIKEVNEINNISTLTDLKLRNNEIGINGDTIDSVFQLFNLVTLDLSRNNISTIPSLIAVDDSNKLPVLETLDLSHNEITLVSNLRETDSIKTIALNNNQINTISNSFNNMEQLTTLLLSTDSIVDENNPKEKPEQNNISRIENSFNNLSSLVVDTEEAETLKFNFNTTNVDIIGSYNDLVQFTKINLNDESIINIDDQSFKLNKVKNINISNNQITNINWIENLPSLNNLNASNNLIAIDKNELDRLDNITSLDLSMNNISSVEFVNKYPNIKVLHLENNQITLEPSEPSLNLLDGFDKLEELYLQYNKITSVIGISNLPELTTLNISDNSDDLGNEITSINGLENLPKLATLEMNTTSINYINGLSSLGDIRLNLYNHTGENLEITPESLKNNKKYTFEYETISLYNKTLHNFEFLSNLTYIKYLDLSYTNIIDLTPISGLTNLQGLWISKQDNATDKITDITPLRNLTSLSALSLDNNQIENINVLQYLINLSNLSLNNNNIQTIKLTNTTSVFDQMSQLNYLSLEGNNSVTELVGLNNLLQLQTLNIPTSIIKFTNTLNGVSDSLKLNNINTNKFSIVSLDVTIVNSFNSKVFTDISLPDNYNRDIVDSFEYVQSLYLGNTLYTNIDFVIGFKNLQFLSLWGNTTIQNIDGFACSTDQLSKLSSVYLGNSNVKTINNSFNNCPNLINVNLGSTITNIQSSFNSKSYVYLMFPYHFNSSITNSFQYIETLEIENTLYSNINFIKDFDSLETLRISYNPNIHSIDGLTCSTSELANLATLDIFDSNITSIINSFSNCSKLNDVKLGYDITTIQDSFNSVNLKLLAFPNNYNNSLTFTNSFKNLETLDVSNTTIKNTTTNKPDYSFIDDLTKLKSLTMNNISGTYISLPVDVSKLSLLEEIYISNITINNLSNQFTNYNNLKIVSLQNVSIGTIENSFADNDNLETINLYNSDIQIITESFKNNPKFTYIDLSRSYNNNISVSIVNSFIGNSNLDSINLQNVNITNINSSFKNNASLTNINCSKDYSNSYYVTITDSFVSNESLESINLYYTYFDNVQNSFNDNNLTGSIKLNGIQSIINSFSNNAQLTAISFYNYGALSIDDSFNDTKVNSFYISNPSQLIKLSGFNNASFTWLSLHEYDNLETISGFNNVKIQYIELVNNPKLKDISFLNNVNQSSIETITFSNLDLIPTSTIKTLINSITNISNSSLSSLNLVNILDSLDGVNLNINKLHTLVIEHPDLNYSLVIPKLAVKTSTDVLLITRDMYDELEIHFRDEIDNNQVEMTIVDELKQDIRDEITDQDLEGNDIEDLIEETFSDRYSEYDILNLVNERISTMVNEKLTYFSIV